MAPLQAGFTLAFVKILYRVPGQLVCILKRLDEALLFQLIQLAVIDELLQLHKRFGKVLKALLPAYVFIFHLS
jgi:hypothetical protein